MQYSDAQATVVIACVVKRGLIANGAIARQER